MSDSPKWVDEIVAATERYVEELGFPGLTHPLLDYTRMEDQRHPNRACAWCLQPRNSPECNFAQRHTPYREMFAPQDQP